MGITQHRHARRRRAGASSTSAWPAATSVATAPGSCRSAATRACRAAPRWAPTPPRCPGGSTRSTPSTPQLAASSGASPCPAEAGLTAPEMVEAAERGELDVLWTSGGNFLDVLPDPPRVEAALGRVPLRVHQDIVLTSQMLVRGRRRDPAAGGHPLRAGGRRHRDHHRAADRVLARRSPAASARPAASGGSSPSVAARVRPDLADRVRLAPTTRRCGPRSPRSCRSYAGIETLADDRRRRAVGRPPPVRRRRLPARRRPGPVLRRSTARPRSTARRARSRCRPGAASSSTRWCCATTDPLTGAGRDAVYIDARRRRAARRRRRRRRSRCQRRRHVRRAGSSSCGCPARSLQVHWPEGNVLSPAGRRTASRAAAGARLQRRRHGRGRTPAIVRHRSPPRSRSPSRPGRRRDARPRRPAAASRRRRAGRRRRDAVRRPRTATRTTRAAASASCSSRRAVR